MESNYQPIKTEKQVQIFYDGKAYIGPKNLVEEWINEDRKEQEFIKRIES